MEGLTKVRLFSSNAQKALRLWYNGKDFVMEKRYEKRDRREKEEFPFLTISPNADGWKVQYNLSERISLSLLMF